MKHRGDKIVDDLIKATTTSSLTYPGFDPLKDIKVGVRFDGESSPSEFITFSKCIAFFVNKKKSDTSNNVKGYKDLRVEGFYIKIKVYPSEYISLVVNKYSGKRVNLVLDLRDKEGINPEVRKVYTSGQIFIEKQLFSFGVNLIFNHSSDTIEENTEDDK